LSVDDAVEDCAVVDASPPPPPPVVAVAVVLVVVEVVVFKCWAARCRRLAKAALAAGVSFRCMTGIVTV
jgi:hypothetical protein